MLRPSHVCTPICLQVLDVDFAAGKATIKLVPRLDLTAMAKDHRSGACWGGDGLWSDNFVVLYLGGQVCM
jgi:hypothetical protein